MASKVVLSPHLDDAVLDCWHILSRPHATVLNIFSKQPPIGTRAWWDGICGESDSHKMVKMRKQENDQAIAISGKHTSQLFLNFLDKQYRRKGNPPFVNALANKIEKISPDNSVFFAPLGIGLLYRHPDHVLARLAGLELLRRGYRVGFFPDCPYMALPHNPVAYRLRRTHSLAESELQLKLIMQINYLSPKQLALKRNAMQAYRTQYMPINIQTLGALSRLGNRGYELLFFPESS